MESLSLEELWLRESKSWFSMYLVWEANLHSRLNLRRRAFLSAKPRGLTHPERLALVHCLVLKLDVLLLDLREGVLGLKPLVQQYRATLIGQVFLGWPILF